MQESIGTKVLPFVLSLIAGSADVIGFLQLGGLFIANMTGNLVLLVVKLVVGGPAPVSHLISVPAFIVGLAAARLLASWLDPLGVAALRPLLFLQFVLLLAFLAIGIAVGPRVDPYAPTMIFAAMLGVCAMAVQTALVQISLTGAPSTAVMTTNITRFAMDLGEVLLGRGNGTKAGERARRTGIAIAGFVVGCGLGAWCQARAGLWSLALPTGLSLAALAMSPAPKRGIAQTQRADGSAQLMAAGGADG